MVCSPAPHNTAPFAAPVVVTVDDMSDERVEVLIKERDADISKNEVMRRVPLHTHVQDQSHHIIIPSYSAWFDYNTIHSIEKRSLPEFFNEKNKSKTPEMSVMLFEPFYVYYCFFSAL